MNENENVFTWSLIKGVGHYHWLQGPLNVLQWKQQLFYVIEIMWHIFKLLQVWLILTIPYGTYY